jgi:hypothetical protein
LLAVGGLKGWTTRMWPEIQHETGTKDAPEWWGAPVAPSGTLGRLCRYTNEFRK